MVYDLSEGKDFRKIKRILNITKCKSAIVKIGRLGPLNSHQANMIRKNCGRPIKVELVSEADSKCVLLCSKLLKDNISTTSVWIGQTIKN